MRWLLVAVVPLALAGCVTEQGPSLAPMALGPAAASDAECLTYSDTSGIGDTLAFGDCETASTSVLR